MYQSASGCAVGCFQGTARRCAHLACRLGQRAEGMANRAWGGSCQPGHGARSKRTAPRSLRVHARACQAQLCKVHIPQVMWGQRLECGKPA